MTEQITRPTQAQAARGAVTGRKVADDVKVALGAALAAALVWVLWTRAGEVELAVESVGGGTRQVGLVAVLVSTVVLVLAGGALLRWLQRRSAQGVRRWTQVAVTFAVVSLLGPTSALTLEAGLGLASLHLVVAAVAVPALRWTHRGR